MHSLRWPHFLCTGIHTPMGFLQRAATWHLPPLAASFPASALPGPSVLAKRLPTPAPAIRGRPGQTLPHAHHLCAHTSFSKCVRRCPLGSIWRKRREGLRSEAAWDIEWGTGEALHLTRFHAPRWGPEHLGESTQIAPSSWHKGCTISFTQRNVIHFLFPHPLSSEHYKGTKAKAKLQVNLKPVEFAILFLSQAAAVEFITGKTVLNIYLDFFF